MQNNQDDELSPLFAAGNPYAGKNSRIQRSLRARAQLRDRKGRFIYMGGGLSSIFRMPDGSLVNTIGRSVGASNREGFAQLMVENSAEGVEAGVYDVPAKNSQVAKAILPGTASTVPYTGPATSADIVDFDSIERRDAPEGWTLNDDGSFASEDGEWSIAQNEEGRWTVAQNDKAIDGDFRDAATAITRATAIDAEQTADEDTKKRVATLRERGSDPIAIDRAIFNAPEFEVGEDADEFFYDEAPAGTKVRTSFKYGDFDDNVNLIGTKQKDGNWTFERNPNEPWNEAFNGFEDTYTPQEILNQFESTQIAELPEDTTVTPINLQEALEKLELARNDYEKLEEDLDATEDIDEQAEIVDKLLETNEQIGELETEVAESGSNTVSSVERRIDRLEREIQRRFGRGEDVTELENEIADLEQRRQALIEAGEQDGGEQAPPSDGGREGTVPGELGGEDARGARVERRGDTLRDSDGNVIAQKVSEPLNAEDIRENGYRVAELFEVDPEYAGLYREALIDAMANHPQGASVTIHDEDYYRQPGVRMFLTQDGKGGITLNGDEIVTGFMARDAADANGGAIHSMISKMVELGGRRLDAFDTRLPQLYARNGFRPVARVRWNDEFAPTVENGAARDWDKADYESYNNGEPDVVFMVYEPDRMWSEYNPEEGQYVEEYDQGVALQEAAVQATTQEAVTQELTDRQKAALARRQATQEANDALLGGDGLLDGAVPQNARGGISNQSLQLAPIGQVVEATSRNGRKRRFIKVGKDTWKRTDKPDDKKRYRSYELRGGTASYVPRTESDIPSVDEVRGPVDRYRPKPFSFPRNATVEELGRLREIYQNQADTDDNVGGALRAAETVRLIDRAVARRNGEPVARLRPAAERRVEDQRAGRPTEPANISGRRRNVAPLLKENAPDASINTEPYTPSENMPEGTTDDPEQLATIFYPTDLANAFSRAIASDTDSVRLLFPGQDGGPGPAANVSLDAVRDTLQRQGYDTNTIASWENQARQEPQLAQEAEAAGRPLPEYVNGEYQSRSAELGHLYQSQLELEAEISNAIARGDAAERIQSLLTTRTGLLNRIRTLELQGFRNTYDVQDVDLSGFEWDGNTPDIYNPDLIMQALRGKYPNSELLPNGDIKIGENIVEHRGKRYKYEAIITRTDDEMFYTYIRETNLAEEDPTKASRSMRFGEMRQSARAANAQAIKALDKIYNRAGRSNVVSWFNDRSRRLAEGRIPTYDVLDENGNPTHVKERVFTREAIRNIQEAVTDADITEEMIGTLFNYINNFGNGGEMAATIYESFGLGVDTMNQFIDAINQNISNRDKLRSFSTWESDNGTPLAEGDLVTYVGGEDQTGFEGLNGRQGRVRIRIMEHTVDGGYTYTDYVYIELLDDNGRPTGENYRPVSSHNLRLDMTAGGTDGSERIGDNPIFVPRPRITRRAVNRYAGRGRLRDVAPFVQDYDRDSLDSPIVNIDGVNYKVQASRSGIITDSMRNISANPADLEVGDFIRTFEDGTVRLNEVVGIEELEDGGRLVHTVMPINISSGRVSSTEYSPDMDLQLDVYRETEPAPAEDAQGLTNGQIARLAEVMRTADTSQLPEATLARIREMLNSSDPASLPYTTAQFADTFMEALQAQRTGTAGQVSLDEAANIMERAIRVGQPSVDAASGVNSVRRAAIQRARQLDQSRENFGSTPRLPQTNASARVNLDDLRTGPYTSNEGASSLTPEQFSDALANGDVEVLGNAIKEYAGNRRFGTTFALDKFEFTARRNYFEWQAKIVDPATGREAGYTIRKFKRDRDGNLVVDHSYVVIRGEGDKGTGFSTEYKQVSDNFYRSVGVDRIDVLTAWDGAYAWGKANYTWKGPASADNMLEALRQKFYRTEKPEDRAILEAMIERFGLPFNDENFPDPIDIANMQKSDGTPWGREIMTNNGWYGVRYLNPDLDPRPESRKNKGKKDVAPEAPAEAPAEMPQINQETVRNALENQDQETLEAIFTNALFGNGERRFGDFFITNVTSNSTPYVMTNEPRYTVGAQIVDSNGEVVGQLSRIIRLNKDGDLRVVHALMEIFDDRNKGTGFSTQFSAASEELYEQMGIAEIQVDTAWDGSYVWARAGYDWDFDTWSPDSTLGEVRERLDDELQAAIASNRLEDARKLEDILDRFTLDIDDPNYPTPFEISSLESEDPDRRNWARELLSDTDWHGIKRLGSAGRTGEEIAAERERDNLDEASADLYTDEEGATD